jgi:NADPH-dependent 2,4-dienoyl-CoA reductase/sulfur reductase-like enzyme
MSSPSSGKAAIERLVVVGASLAGLRAVEAARRSGFTGTITLVGAEPHLPYDRPPLSKDFLDPAQDVETTEFRERTYLEGDLDVRLVLGEAADGLDTDERRVRVGNESIAYDALVVCTGAAARLLPGTDSMAGVHVLRGLEDARAIRAGLDARARTVIIGAGFIGSEVASAARARGLDATVIEARPTPLTRAVGPTLGRACTALHERNGTTVLCGTGVKRLEGNGRVERVILADGSTIEADLVVVGIGAIPNTDWLSNSAVAVADGVVCDERLASTAPGVYAAGDVARWHNPRFNKSMRIEHWTSAAEQGARAALNAIDPGGAKRYATVPYFWSDWYGSRIQFVGVPTGDDYEIVSGHLDSDHFVALYRSGDTLSGALTLNGQRHIMKYRRLIDTGASFDAGLELAADLGAQAAAKS